MKVFYTCLIGVLLVLSCTPSENPSEGPPEQPETTSDFDLIWYKTYGGSFGDALESGIVDEGGYVLVGYSVSSDGDVPLNRGWEDAWILKIDEDGNILESRTYGGSAPDRLVGILKVEDGYVLVGYSNSSDGDLEECVGYEDVWVFRLENFEIVWSAKIGGRLPDKSEGILKVEDGYITYGFTDSYDGDFEDSHGSYDAWMAEIGEGGSVRWVKMYGGSRTDGFNKVLKVDEGFLVLGSTASTEVDLDIENTDVWILKTDENGNILWQRNYGESGWESGVDMIDVGNGYVVLAWTTSRDEDNDQDVWVFKIDREGNMVWSYFYGGSSKDLPTRIFEEEDGYIVVAYSNSPDGNVNAKELFDMWIFQINEDGEIVRNEVFDFGGDERAFGAFLDGDSILVVGTSGDDAMAMKVSK